MRALSLSLFSHMEVEKLCRLLARFDLGCVWEMRKGVGRDGIFGNVPMPSFKNSSDSDTTRCQTLVTLVVVMVGDGAAMESACGATTMDCCLIMYSENKGWLARTKEMSCQKFLTNLLL